MEFVILVGLAIVLVVLLGGATLALNGMGAPLWNAEISRMTKAVWGCGFALALGIAALWLGPALVTTWPYFAGLLIFTVGGFKLGDRLAGVKDKPTAQAASWDTMWRSYEGRPLPGWMLEAASRGRVTYDGKTARVVDGRLAAPDGTPTTGGKSDRAAWSSVKKALWD